MAYSSSLTDKEWKLIEPLLPQKKQTRPPHWTKRQILDGIFYQLKNGCNWCDLPKDLPPYSTVFWHYKQWRSDGVLEQIMCALHVPGTRTGQKKPKWTRLLIIDSQAVKNTCNASVNSKGFCHYKCTPCIKRHLAVDTLGLPFFTHCTPRQCVRRPGFN
jgi:transposase